jgi:hypothetical protein
MRTVFRNDKTVLKLPAVTLLRNCLRFSFDSCIYVGLSVKVTKLRLEMSTRHGQTVCTELQSMFVVKQHAVCCYNCY